MSLDGQRPRMGTHESRCIDNPQTLGALHPQIRIQRALLTLAHRDRAHRMVNGVGLVANERIDLRIGLRLGKVAKLTGNVVRESG